MLYWGSKDGVSDLITGTRGGFSHVSANYVKTLLYTDDIRHVVRWAGIQGINSLGILLDADWNPDV